MDLAPHTGTSTTTRASVDIVVIGAGHNGLVCAGYLAQAGLEVLVLEAAAQVGGNTRTEPLTLDGFAHDSCSSAHVLIQANPLLRDDELGLLSRFGLQYVYTDPAVVLPQHGGRTLVMHRDLAATLEEISRYSTRDAEAFRTMLDTWTRGGLAAEHGRYNSALDLGTGEAAEAYRKLRARSAWDVIHETFEHPTVRSFLSWLAFATILDPRRAGTGTLPASIAAGRLSFGWATPVGGSQALPDALVRLLRARGGDVRVSSPVEAVHVESGRASAVTTVDGLRVEARKAVVSSAHLVQLGQMVRGTPTCQDLTTAASAWRPGLSLFAVHAALDGPLKFGAEGIASVAAGFGSSTGLSDQIDAHDCGEADPRDPWLLVVNQSVADASRAPGNGSTFKILTIAPYERADGRDWADAKPEYAEALVDIVRRNSQGLEPESILALRAESPVDVAGHNHHNLGGSCHGGEFLINGEGSRGWHSYRTSVPGLFLTGSTVHPGGSVSGRPGRNSARAVLTELGMDPLRVMGSG